MRHFIAAAALVALALPALAADAKPNTLTPKEIADGWILLFDGETTFGLRTVGEVKASDGVLTVGGHKTDGSAFASRALPSFELRFEYKLPFDEAGKDRSVKVLVNSYTCASLLSSKGETWNEAIVRVNPGSSKATIRYSTTRPPMTREVEFRDRDVITPPQIEIGVPPGRILTLRTVKLRPLDLKPLFNGKDLTGWKEFPGKKSKFSVTTEGWLNVKNGPGDLQTEGKYDDFLLQLECISNGKHLNSGIFFRCIADQYQNGYEAQIQNGYKDNDRTKPVDFGTGAIYRRVPARKVVSNDHEWFTMTVLAQGNHIATWVNGYQTVDWTDERPADENPRKGSKTGKGHISIQGHDPTTDLSFRNLRIVELPRK
jgi:hypothetical protein